MSHPAATNSVEAKEQGYQQKINFRHQSIHKLRCVIKGQTPHFDFISQASTTAIMTLSIDSRKPIGNGIITCLNMKQAKERKKKGAEAAKAIISILNQR